MAARGGRYGGRERAAAAGRSGWNWIWGCVGSAELGNGFEQFAPVAYRRHADVLEIIGRQLRQHFPIDFVIAEVGLVSLETPPRSQAAMSIGASLLTLLYPPQPSGKIQFAAVLMVDLRLADPMTIDRR
jgi:hypothetical protein